MTESEKTNDDAPSDAPVYQTHILQILTGVYLWLLFGYMSLYLNCDLQRIFHENALMLHVFGFVTVFLLFTNQAPKNVRIHPGQLFLRTLTVYMLWILASKTKWYVILSVLFILFMYEMAVLILDYIYHPSVSTVDETRKKKYIKAKFATGVLITISVVVVFGVLDYMRVQLIEHRSHFSLWDFFVKRGLCKAKSMEKPSNLNNAR